MPNGFETEFHYASIKGKCVLPFLRFLQPKDIAKMQQKKPSALILALENNAYHNAAALLHYGFDKAATNKHEKTAEMMIRDIKHPDLINELQNTDKNAQIDRAVMDCDLPTFERLLLYGRRPHKTCIACASEIHKKKIIQILWKHAFKSDKVEFAEMALSEGTEFVKEQMIDDAIPLVKALLHGNPAIIKCILNYYCSADEPVELTIEQFGKMFDDNFYSKPESLLRRCPKRGERHYDISSHGIFYMIVQE